MEHNARTLRVLVLVVGLVVYGVAGPGVAAAQSGVGGNIVVGPDETVSSIDAVTGSIVIEGTVTGDVSGVAGNVVIDGTVEGNVNVAAGDITIRGEVLGDVSGATGNLNIGPDGRVAGDLDTGAGTVTIAGTVEGDARIGAETITLADGASIGGSLTYDGELRGDADGVVAGDVTRDPSIGVGLFDEIQPFVQWVFAVNVFLINLLLGAVLVGLFPRFSDGVAARARASPLWSGLAGLGVLIAVPILLIATAITVIGLPITLVGALFFALLAWIGLIYGRFAVGVWLLSLAGVESRWGGLVVGLLLGAVLWQIPIVGGFLNFAVFLLGLGALVYQLFSRRRRLGSVPTPEETPAEETSAE